MKAVSIRYRFADFLKNHPPFNFMEERDLLSLAEKGRVKFHEAGETIFNEGDRYGKFLFVVQKGTVEIYRHAAHGIELTDLRGAGDIIGLSRFLGHDYYHRTAQTASDVIIYAIPWEDFKEMVAKYPKVSRYFASYFSINPHYTHLDPFGVLKTANEAAVTEAPNRPLTEVKRLHDLATSHLLKCDGETSVREVACVLAETHREVMVVATEEGFPEGILTERNLLQQVATGLVSVEAPARDLMTTPVIAVAPGLSVGEMILRMIRDNVRHLCITQDGTVHSPAVGVISERDFLLLYGKIPTVLGKDIHNAINAKHLGDLRDRADQLFLEMLEERMPFNWLSEVGAEINDAIIQRAIALAQKNLAEQGWRPPKVAWCWLALGSAGRSERVLRMDQDTALVYTDPKDEKEKEQVQEYFHKFAECTLSNLAFCTFVAPTDNVTAVNPSSCKSLSEWKASYLNWIESPVENGIMELRTFFDLRRIAGSRWIAEDLKKHIAEAISKNEIFVALIANDTLGAQPPVTLFRGYALDREGKQHPEFDIKLHALQPLADIARVFALREGYLEYTNTGTRFRRAAKTLPDAAGLFGEAAEAFRVAGFYRALTGLKEKNEGRMIRPGNLKRTDQEIIKSVFQTVIKLLEFTARYFHFGKLR